MKKEFLKKELINYAYILAGTFFLALSVVWFFVANELITGGSAGLSLLLHYITPYTIGTLMIVINAPLLLLGSCYVGKMFAVRTVVTIVLISLCIDFMIEILHVQAFVHNIILASIFGGIGVGIGLALVIKGNSSAGGSTIVATIIASKSEIKPSTVILFIDAVIILSALFIFDDVERILWSVVSIYVTSKVIDKILTGNINKKVVYLVSNEVHTLCDIIREDIGPDGTILNGQGLFENQEKNMILLVVEVSKLQRLREIVKENDPKGFLVITEASEFLGRGH